MLVHPSLLKWTIGCADQHEESKWELTAAAIDATPPACTQLSTLKSLGIRNGTTKLSRPSGQTETPRCD